MTSTAAKPIAQQMTMQQCVYDTKRKLSPHEIHEIAFESKHF